ncbi:cutinase family protein [Rathayibacter caricis]|nr:cutinase family protein [Rathayibacter caricis]
MLPKLSSRARIAMLLLIALVLTALPAAPAAAATAFTTAPTPTITGTTSVGSTLTANQGTWNPVPTFTYQWKRGTTVITGATAKTYKPITTDVGKTLTVTITGTKTGYTTTSKTSLATAAIKAPAAFTAAPVPTVTGSTTVGATLTANSGTWNPVPTFTYQWKRGTTSISGATASTYKPVTADVGATLTVTVTGTKTGYTTTPKTSAPTAAIKAPAAFTAAPTPTITGTTSVGSTLTANTGTWNPVPTFTYQWKRGSTAITGATASTYKPVTADVGATLTVTVTGTKTGYTTTTKISAATAAIKAAAATAFTAAPTPTITGTASVGSTLTANAGTWNPVPTFTYQWKRGSTAITGATASTYRPVTADVGATLTVTVTGTKTGYTTTSKTSLATAAIKAAAATAFTAAPTPTITGTASVGSTLTANTGTWNPVPTFTYQWKRGSTAITGATASTYKPVTADVGATLTVTVTGTKTGYTTTTKTSAATAAIASEGMATFTTAPQPSLGMGGTPMAGSTLFSHAGTWKPTPTSLAYQWTRNSIAIAGATSSTYIATRADIGANIGVTVTASKTGYATTAKVSTSEILIQPKILVSGPISADTTWTPDYPYVLQEVWDGRFYIEPGATLTIQAGTSIESVDRFVVQGSLKIAGTNTNPVKIKFIDVGDWWAPSIEVEPRARVEITNLIQDQGYIISDNAKMFSLTKSNVPWVSAKRDWSNRTIYQEEYDYKEIVITDNTFERLSINSGWRPYYWDPATIAPIEAQRNTVYDDGAAVKNGFGGAIEITDYQLQPSTFSGTKVVGSSPFVLKGRLVEDWTIPAGNGYLFGESGDYFQVFDSSLTVQAGATMKFVNTLYDRSGLYIGANGRFISEGTSTSPVVLTCEPGSEYYNYPQCWQGLSAAAGAEVNLSNTEIRHARVGLNVYSEAKVWMRGSFVQNAVAVRTEGNAYVDARESDWGSPSGPSKTDIEGRGVDYIPWKGWETIPRPAIGEPQPVPNDTAEYCPALTAFGLRGSGEAPRGIWLGSDDGWSKPTFEGESDGFGDLNATTLQHIETQMGVTSGLIKRVAIQYQAEDVPVVDEHHGDVFTFWNSIYDGVDKLKSRLEREYADCGDKTRYVILGYSQGALSTHKALQELGDDDSPVLKQIAAVGLISDPARNLDQQESFWSAMPVVEDQLVATPPSLVLDASVGSWSLLIGTPVLPASITSVTTSICHEFDTVCAVRPGANMAEHFTYQSDLRGLAYEIASRPRMTISPDL